MKESKEAGQDKGFVRDGYTGEALVDLSVAIPTYISPQEDCNARKASGWINLTLLRGRELHASEG